MFFRESRCRPGHTQARPQRAHFTGEDPSLFPFFLPFLPRFFCGSPVQSHRNLPRRAVRSPFFFLLPLPVLGFLASCTNSSSARNLPQEFVGPLERQGCRPAFFARTAQVPSRPPLFSPFMSIFVEPLQAVKRGVGGFFCCAISFPAPFLFGFCQLPREDSSTSKMSYGTPENARQSLSTNQRRPALVSRFPSRRKPVRLAASAEAVAAPPFCGRVFCEADWAGSFQVYRMNILDVEESFRAMEPKTARQRYRAKQKSHLPRRFNAWQRSHEIAHQLANRRSPTLRRYGPNAAGRLASVGEFL